MGAYHFSAKIHSRAKGASAVRAAAYRAGAKLHDERAGKTENYSRKADVVRTAILAPEGAPAWCLDREQLWNRVEDRENRRDAQVAREFEINLPRELSDAENWRLVTDFARSFLVPQGRICDIAFHKGRAHDGQDHPHAHILMPLRLLSGDGFGGKHPDTDWRKFLEKTNRLERLREQWCEFARNRAAELGIDLGPDWDHRSYQDRGIDIEAEPKVGATAHRLARQYGSAERVDELKETVRRNGERLLSDPGLALAALTNNQSTFTERDLAKWIHRHSDDDQFEAIFLAAKERAVVVGRDDRGTVRFSTREMVELEQAMLETADDLAAVRRHNVDSGAVLRNLAKTDLSSAMQSAAEQVLIGSDLNCIVGYAGAGKSTMLGEMQKIWQARGYQVKGATLSGIAAENLEEASGIRSRTLASWMYSWKKGTEKLSAKDILVVDEAGMVGSRQMAYLLDQVQKANAKIILVGDPEQLQAIEAGAAFRAIAERAGSVELTEVWRQRKDWQRSATAEFATGNTRKALTRYQDAGAIVVEATQEAARVRLVAEWIAARSPERSAIIMAHTRKDAAVLNQQARRLLNEAGQLGVETELETSRGKMTFAKGDRVMFLRNDRSLGVKNGTLGTAEFVAANTLQVRTDDGRQIKIDLRNYADIAHGYAVTIHKAQGVSVDQSFVLASAGFDRHLTYVAMSRHRDRVKLFWGQDEFPKGNIDLFRTLSRERSKDVTSDYQLDIASARDLSVGQEMSSNGIKAWPGRRRTSSKSPPWRGPER